ncbi:unnamed protein product [Cuscuta campestris]|uniref:Reverse transcriptase domain-containing protein n=1 Tax=Cuscuta campestris TaxID=132261 RepID=A0A484KQ69_9ASTE|nr:unnamed protein product [Cuscuta campestris]
MFKDSDAEEGFVFWCEKSGERELSSPASLTPESAAAASRGGLSRLFSDVVANGTSAKGLEGKITGYHDGVPTVTFTKNDISELSYRFKHALVAKFHSRPSFSVMQSFMQKLGLLGAFDIAILSSKSFLLNFQKEEDYIRLFLRRVWRVFGSTMALSKWSPTLSQGIESSVLPIWIAFPNLPIHLHDKRALHLLASSIGHPLQVDSCTLNFSRPQLARCCVEVDITNLPPGKIHGKHDEEELVINFYYENVPSYCMVVTRKKGKDKKPTRVWKVKDRQVSMEVVPWCEGLGENSSRGEQQRDGPDIPAKLQSGTFVINSNLLAAFNMTHLHGSLSSLPSSLVVDDPPLDVRDDSLAIVPFVDSLAIPEDDAAEVGFFADGSSIDEVYRALSSPEERIERSFGVLSDLSFLGLALGLLGVTLTRLLLSWNIRESKFTWAGKRRKGRVYRRLDRILLNEECMEVFPVLEVRHLGRGYKGGGMRGLAIKLAELKRALLQWIKDVFGNIFEEVSKAEERAFRAEQNLENDDTEENVVECNMAKALLQLAHKKEESFWSQKANIKWISQGDASTVFFHSFVRGRRHRLYISSLKTAAGALISSQEEIANEAVDHFSRVFSHVHEGDMGEILCHIPSILSLQDNYMLGALPEEEEIRKTVWALNANSAAGADGYNGFFFRHAWDVIKVDVCKGVQEFFLGIPLPRVFGSTLITLIPKMEGAITLDQFRPISLSTFFSKILSRILSDRLKNILPLLISPEQVAFQQGKGINEHVLIVKEMMHLLSFNARGGNCMVKLDLSKAFDKISWAYLEQVLLKFGFFQRVIHLLMGNLRSTFFSVLINGQPKGFFFMKCGVKQGDPLSPLLFIIAMEGFSRNLLRLKAALSTFCLASGQEINFSKSHVIVHDKMRQEYKVKIRSILGIRCIIKEFTYLGSTIVRAQEVPKSIIKSLHRLMANFFWGAKDKDLGFKYHWRQWEKLCFPLQEGGLGVRNLHHCQKVAAMDLWWKVQQGGTIW